MDAKTIGLPPRWAVWSGGFLLVAGILHLTALPAHAGQARGLGIFFLGLGAAQVVWACVTLFRSTSVSARIGLAMLAVAPVVIWALTRTLRAPWSTEPEPVDIIGLGTVLLELAAAVTMAFGRAGLDAPSTATPAVVRRAVTVFVIVGIAAGALGYGGALAAEASIPWLGEAEAAHHAADVGGAIGEEAAAEGEAEPHPHAD